jgi:basic amino acid/polyamine antiporter, APA family
VQDAVGVVEPDWPITMGVWTKKSVDDLRAESERAVLRRSLGPLNLTALGIGSIIGTGIFVLTGTAASQNAGPGLIFSMMISAIGCAFSGLCYAEFAAMVPVAGSAYTYAYATSGELIAWIIGWDLILEYALSVSTVAVGWSGYFVSLARDLGWVVPPAIAGPSGAFNLPAMVIVLIVAALLLIGIRESANVNTALVVVKIAVLVVFVTAGAAYVNRANLTPLVPANTGAFGSFGWSGILRGAGVMFFAYIGFDAVSTAAQEAKHPERDMPIGILVSLGICTALYIAVAVVLLGIVPYRRLDVADPLAIGIDATGMTWLSPFVKVAALFGLFSTMLVQLLAQTRIFYSMSRDGLLPPLFASVHPRFRTPHVSTIITAVIIAMVAGLTPITALSQLVSIGTLFAFVLVSIGVIVLRRTSPDVPRPFRTPGVPWVPIAGALVCLAQMIGLPLATWERLFIWLAIGLVIYATYGARRQSKVSHRKSQVRLSTFDV